MNCIYHGKTTRNTRQLTETVTEGGDRKKKHTYIKAKEYPYSLYVFYKTVRNNYKKTEQRKAWIVDFTCIYYTYLPLQNPFYYIIHRFRIPEKIKIIELAQAHRNVGLSADESTRILN